MATTIRFYKIIFSHLLNNCFPIVSTVSHVEGDKNISNDSQYHALYMYILLLKSG